MHKIGNEKHMPGLDAVCDRPLRNLERENTTTHPVPLKELMEMERKPQGVWERIHDAAVQAVASDKRSRFRFNAKNEGCTKETRGKARMQV